jgi:hypothetical protein
MRHNYHYYRFAAIIMIVIIILGFFIVVIPEVTVVVSRGTWNLVIPSEIYMQGTQKIRII